MANLDDFRAENNNHSNKTQEIQHAWSNTFSGAYCGRPSTYAARYSSITGTGPAFHVVAEAGDGASAIDLANRIEPDLILLDLNMKGLSGLDTLNALRRDGVTAQIIILTVSDSASDIYALIDAGADGYLLKDSDPEVLLEAIRKGANGGKVFSDRVNEYLRERERFGAQEDPFSILTERELDVLHELAQGLSNKQIASVLNISEQTVKVHIRNLLRKLNVRSRVAATILFLQTRGMQ